MNTLNTVRNVFLFDDDPEVRRCWELMVENNGIPNVQFFASWEEFLQTGDANQIRDAVIFVDFNFNLVNSRFDGIHIATELKRMGAQVIYSISGNSGIAATRPDLFKSHMPKFPTDLKALVSKS